MHIKYDEYELLELFLSERSTCMTIKRNIFIL